MNDHRQIMINEDEQESPVVTIPERFLPDLEEYGIEPEQRGVCLDTPENRAIIAMGKLKIVPLFMTDGTLSNHILVVNSEYEGEIRDANVRSKGAILEDKDDINSDYKTDVDLLLVTEYEKYVPHWVVMETKRFVEIRKARFEKGDPNYLKNIVRTPVRCVRIKQDGRRCMRWSAGTSFAAKDPSLRLCAQHYEVTEKQAIRRREGVERKARATLAELALNAVNNLGMLAEHADSDAVRLKANTEILDRAGIRGGVEITGHHIIEERPAADVLAERLSKMRPAVVEATFTEIEDDSTTDRESTT